MKKLLVVGLGLMMAFSLAACGSDTVADTQIRESAEEMEVGEEGSPDPIDYGTQVAMEIEGYGEIVLQLDPTAAPVTVDNFLKLVNEGFYDGLTFHRIIDGFMIQGGDPLGTGTGGSDEQIFGEFASNGFENHLSHERGVISMARAQDPNSASSQFFIVHEDATFLDGDYASFGWVISGMDIVDAIAEGTPVQDGNGSTRAEDQPVIISMKVLPTDNDV